MVRAWPERDDVPQHRHHPAQLAVPVRLHDQRHQQVARVTVMNTLTFVIGGRVRGQPPEPAAIR